MAAARDVDQRAAELDLAERAVIEDAARMRGERKEADGHIASLQHAVEVGHARDALEALRSPAPADDVEVERAELPRRVAAELAQAEDADGAVGSEVLLEPLPAPRLLFDAIYIVMAMPVEHVREHGLRHRRHHAGIDEPRERHALRVRRIGEQPLDAH